MIVTGPLLESLAFPFWIALLVSAVFAAPIYKLLLRLKSRQTVSQYAPEGHQVKQGTPTMGGLIIAVGAVAAWLAILFVPGHLSYGEIRPDVPAGMGPPRLVIAALVLFVPFALIGFVDDFVVPRMMKGKRGLGWKQKIVMQFVAAWIAAYLVYSNIPGQLLAVFLILFFSNAYNFSDGLDGLAGTLLLGLGAGLAALAWLSPGGHFVAPIVVTLLGAVIPFLFVNAPPAKVFMGDVGSLPIGAVLGLCACLLCSPRHGWTFYTPYASVEAAQSVGWFALPEISVPETLAVFLVSFMMVVELVPVPLQILSVKLRKKKLFLYTPIHHAFEKSGWPESRVVYSFALMQLVFSALGVIALTELSPHVQASIPQRYHYYYAPQSKADAGGQRKLVVGEGARTAQLSARSSQTKGDGPSLSVLTKTIVRRAVRGLRLHGLSAVPACQGRDVGSKRRESEHLNLGEVQNAPILTPVPLAPLRFRGKGRVV